MNKTVNRRGKKRIPFYIKAICVVLSLVLTVCILSPVMDALAVNDTDKAITYKEYRASHAVPEKMLFIGTYLVHKDALTSAVYSKALESQTEYSQFNYYYNSEIGGSGSAWYDIGGADGLSAVTTNGIIVDESQMDPLYVTYVINADGTVVNAKTGAAGSVFDNPDPYNVSELPEFQALKAQYQATYSDKSEGVDKYCYLALKDFWNTNLHDEETDELDRILANLNTAYTTMKGAGADTEANLIMDLMTQIDNQRRSIVYKKLVIDENMKIETGKSLDDIRSGYEYTDEDIAAMDEEERNKVLSNREELESEADKEADKYKGENPTSVLLAKMTGTGYDTWTDSNKQFTYNEIYDYLKKREDPDDVNMNKWESQVEDINSSSKYIGGDLTKEEFKVNQGVVDTLNTAIGDCKTSYTNYTKNLLEDDSTVLGHAMCTEKEAIINIAKSASTGMDANLRRLALLNCIRDNTIKDGPAELELLENNLIPLAASNYASAVTSGADTHTYTVALQGGTQYAYESALKAQDAETSSKRSEFETLIEAKELRISTTEAYEYLSKCLSENEVLSGSVPNDYYKDYASGQILNHKLWINEELNKLKSKDASLLSDSEKLAEQKKDLLEQRQKALDDNDRNAVAKYNAKIDKLDDAIKEANAKNGGAGTSADDAIDRLKTKALSDLANGGDGKDGLDALAALGATDAIKDIAKEAGFGNTDSVANALRDSQNNNANGIGNDLNNSAGSGKNDGKDTGDNAGKDTGDGAGKDSGDNTKDNNGSDAKDNSGNDAKDNSGNDAKDNSGNDAKDNSGNDAKDNSGSDAKDNSGNDAKDNSGNDAGDNNSQDQSDSSGSGTGSSTGRALTKGEIESALSDFFNGRSFSDLRDDEKIIAAVACYRYGMKGNTASKELAKNYIDICASEKNKYVYDSTYDPLTEYASLKAIGRCTDFRYIYESNKYTGTLEGKRSSFTFTKDTDTVTQAMGTTSTMPYKAHFYKDSLYIPAETALDIFNLTVNSISNSDFSAILSGAMENKADELFSILEQGA